MVQFFGYLAFLTYKVVPLSSVKRLSFDQFKKIANQKVNKSYWLTYLETILAALLETVILKTSYKIFHFIVRIFSIPLYLVFHQYHSIVRTNFKLALGQKLSEQEIKKFSKKSFATTMINLGEVARFITLEQTGLLKNTVLTGWDHLEKSYRKKKGVLLFSAHYGNFLYPMIYLSVVKKIKINFIIRQLDNPLIGFVAYNALSDKKITPIIRKNSAVKMALKALEKGEIVYLLMDQNVAVGGIFVPFFSHPASTFRGIYSLQKKTGCQVMGCHDYRDQDEKHTLTFLPMIKEKSEYGLILKINQQIEGFIRKDPLQHLWLHPRWKRQPPGQPNPYQKIKNMADK